MISKPRILATAMILAAVISFPLGSVHAQTAIHLSQLTIRLWPEFDKPGVLVFLIGQTASDTTLPAELKFTLPPGSTVNAIAYVDTANNVLTDTVPHTIDGQNVSITTPNGNFRIEFYDPGLSIDHQQRSYHFTWQGNYVVDQLTWEAEQPAGATNFKVAPAGGANLTDENGLLVYQFKTTAPAAGQAASISVSYDKQDNTFTADALAASKSATGSAAQPVPSASQSESNNTLTIVIVVVILIAVVTGIGIALTRGAFTGIGIPGVDAVWPPQQRARETRGRAAKKLGKKPAPGQRFCHQCGQPALPGDLFCRTCGAKLHGK